MARRSGIEVFKIAGIHIHVDPSWFFIFILISWSLASGVFPEWHPDWSVPFNIFIGVTAALLFFASVLAHELAHALVAKSRGLPVRRITLFLFGGVSNLEREPTSAKTEFLMAVVGPLTSIGLGILFLVMANMIPGPRLLTSDPLQALTHRGPVSTLLLWLGPVNIIVGIFNLVPGFPLDGGRILRSAIWGATGNLRRATMIATGVGQAIGWLFIFAGITIVFGISIPFLGGGILNGIWLILIGWFLSSAAESSRRQSIIDDLLEDIPVGRLMRSEVPMIPPQTSIYDLVNHWIINSDERAFPVVEGDRFLGLVCLADIRKVPRELWRDTPVREIVTPASELAIANPEEDSAQALYRLMRKDVRQLPVMQDGHFVGLLRRRDILRWVQIQSGEFPT